MPQFGIGAPAAPPANPGSDRRIGAIPRPHPAVAIENAGADRYGCGARSQPEDPSLTPSEQAAVAAPAPIPPAAAADGPAGAELLAAILASLEDDKAEDIVSIDLSRRSSMADHMVIASGRSSRQVAAIASKLLDRLKERFRLSARVEGKEIGDWVLIDTGDVVVHVFRPEVRSFYQLEKMWQVPGTGGTAAPN